jgi:adenylate cyclase
MATPAKPDRLRSLAVLGRKVVRRTILDDPTLRDQLDRLGVLNPDIRSDPDADPLKPPTPRKALAAAITAVANRDRTSLGSAGVGGLEALAAVLETENTGDMVADVICVGFTDIVNFTAYTQTEGDDAALATLKRQEQVARQILRSRGGAIVKRLGDGLMLRFPTAPAGVAGILDLFDRLGGDDLGDFGKMQMRAGLVTGRPLKHGTDLVGSDVNLAARVTSVAKADQLLVTEDVVLGCGDDLPGVSFKARGRKKLKGFDDRVDLWEAGRTEAAN